MTPWFSSQVRCLCTIGSFFSLFHKRFRVSGRMSWTAKSGSLLRTIIGFWAVMNGRSLCTVQMKTEGHDPRLSFILSLFLLYIWMCKLVPMSPTGGMFNALPLLSGLSWHQFRIHGLFHMEWFYMVQALEDVPFPTFVVSPLLLTSCCLTRCYNVAGAPARDFPLPLALQSDSLFSVEVSEDVYFSLLVP